MHGLPNLEQPVSQSHRLAVHSLLYMHGALTERASFHRLLDCDEYPGENSQPSLIPILQGSDLLFQDRECRERENVVFFRP